MPTKINRILVLILLSIATFSCNNAGAILSRNSESLIETKWRLSQSKPLGQATPLRTIVNYNLKKQFALGYPSSFVISQDTNLFLVDNRTSSLFKISSDFQSFKQVVKKDENNGSLEFPNQIKEFNNNFYINDNEGVKVFSNDGIFEYEIKPHFGMADFTLLKNGEFLVNRNLSEVENDSPLIMKLDSTGRIIDTIGRIKSVDYLGIENQVYLEPTETSIIVAYKYNPLVEIYDLKTKRLLTSFNVTASIFDDLTALKQNKEFIKPEPGKFKVPKFIAGVKLFKDKIYILLHLPHPEIIEFTFNGEEVQRYRSTEVRTNDYFGFDTRLINDTTQFVVGLFDNSQKPFILVYEKTNK